MKTSNKLLLGLLVVVILLTTVIIALSKTIAQSEMAETQIEIESQTQKYEKLEVETTSHILSFQMRGSEIKSSKNESKTTVSTYNSVINGETKSLRDYKYTVKTLLEIYQLIAQEIPQSKFILSETLTDEQTKLLAKSFDVEIETIFSPETAKEIFQKLDFVSGLQR